jgi:hypothetical protein
MEDIRNNDGRLVCRIGESENGNVIEIIIKNCKTLICFTPDCKMIVINSNVV